MDGSHSFGDTKVPSRGNATGSDSIDDTLQQRRAKSRLRKERPKTPRSEDPVMLELAMKEAELERRLDQVNLHCLVTRLRFVRLIRCRGVFSDGKPQAWDRPQPFKQGKQPLLDPDEHPKHHTFLHPNDHSSQRGPDA